MQASQVGVDWVKAGTILKANALHEHVSGVNVRPRFNNIWPRKYEKAMMSLEFVTFDGPPDELCHKEVAFFLHDAHQHVSPVFHWDARSIRDKVLSVPVKQQESANPMFVVNGFIPKTLDLLQRSVAIQKHLFDLTADR